MIGSHGRKLSQRLGTFQPPYGRLTPALCPQLSLQRSFLAQGPSFLKAREVRGGWVFATAVLGVLQAMGSPWASNSVSPQDKR